MLAAQARTCVLFFLHSNGGSTGFSGRREGLDSKANEQLQQRGDVQDGRHRHGGSRFLLLEICKPTGSSHADGISRLWLSSILEQ
ncbi:hypothetical protein D3C81_1854750 [compost metagenome]